MGDILMIHHFCISNNKIISSGNAPSEIVVIINPDEKEKKVLIEDYKLDEHTLNSSLDPDELSRFEIEPDHTAIIFKRPKNYSGTDNLLFKVSSSGIFLFKDKLIMVMNEDLPIFEGKLFTKVTNITDVSLKIIYGSIFHFFEHLKIFNLITDELEKKINSAMENKYLLNLFTLEKSLVYYLNAINSNAVLIEKLKNNAAKFGLSTENIEFLDDMIIENNQCYRQAEIYSNILASLMDARASIVGNNLNVLMKTLNIITICIMVPTFVVSAFSMNVGIPLQGHPLAFWIIMSLALSSIVGVLFLWKKKKW
jgi:magnesium transporter